MAKEINYLQFFEDDSLRPPSCSLEVIHLVSATNSVPFSFGLLFSVPDHGLLLFARLRVVVRPVFHWDLPIPHK